MAVEINPLFRVFTDVDGEPLEDGYIHIGAVNQNPQAVPISVFWDSALTIPAAQPIRTLGGYPSRSGTPSRMYVAESAYSISVSNKNSTLIYSDLNNQSGDQALRQDLANETDTTKGAGLIGWSRSPLASAVASTLPVAINSLEISIWEFVHLVNRTGAQPWDWTAAAQAAYASAFALGGGTIRVPAGTYLVSGTGITTNLSDSYYRMTDPAICWKGDGIATAWTRAESLATDTPERNTPADFDESVFNIHNSNNILEDMRFYDAKTAIYLGHKLGEDPASCHASMNRFNRIWIHDCGFGIHARSGLGIYYNSFNDSHIWQCQAGIFLGAHPESLVVPPNTNRNQFRNVRTARCHVGLWLKKGDTNQFFGQHNEGNSLTPTNNRYAAFTGLPGGLTTGIGQLVEVDGTNNQFEACMQEACEVELYNAAINNSFSGLYRADKCVFVEKPYRFSIRDMAVTDAGRSFYLANTRTDAFVGRAAGVNHTLNNTRSEGYQEIGLSGSLKIGAVYDREFLLDIGPVAPSASFASIIWADSTTELSDSAFIEIDIIGNSQTNSLAIATSFKVAALRNASRTLTRFFAYDVVTGRATGAPAGDATEGFSVVLSTDGSKNLIATVTAAARTFESVLVRVKRMVGAA